MGRTPVSNFSTIKNSEGYFLFLDNPCSTRPRPRKTLDRRNKGMAVGGNSTPVTGMSTSTEPTLGISYRRANHNRCRLLRQRATFARHRNDRQEQEGEEQRNHRTGGGGGSGSSSGGSVVSGGSVGGVVGGVVAGWWAAWWAVWSAASGRGGGRRRWRCGRRRGGRRGWRGGGRRRWRRGGRGRWRCGRWKPVLGSELHPHCYRSQNHSHAPACGVPSS